MESRVALIGIIVENEDAVENSTVFYTNTADTLSAEWVFLTERKNKYYKYSGGRSSGYNKRNVR